MAVIDVHPKVFHIKDCGTSTVRWCSLHFHMLREIKVRRMDISIRCYAMNLTYRSSNVLLFAIEKKSIINTWFQKTKISFHLLMFQEGEHGLDEHKLHMYLSALQSLIPSLFALVLQNAPFSSKAKLHGEVPQIEGTELKLWEEDVEY